MGFIELDRPIGFLTGTLGYGWLSTLDDILSLSAIPALICVGMGLGSCQLASTVLLAQEARTELRGSVFGTQAFFGAAGILAMSAGGGRLFDAIGPQAPFLAVAAANGVVLLFAVACRVVESRQRSAAI